MYILKFFQNESRPHINSNYQTPVFNPQINAPHFYPGYLNSLHSSSPIPYQHQQASLSQSSTDTTHHNIYSEPEIIQNQFSQLPSYENITSPYQPTQHFPPHYNPQDSN